MVEKHKEDLIQLEAMDIFKTCGVWMLLTTLKKYLKKQEEVKTPLSKVGELDEISVKFAMKSLTSYIFSIQLLQMPAIDRIADVNIRQSTRNGVALIIFDAYQCFFSALSDPFNAYGESVHELLSHPPSQVKKKLKYCEDYFVNFKNDQHFNKCTVIILQKILWIVSMFFIYKTLVTIQQFFSFQKYLFLFTINVGFDLTRKICVIQVLVTCIIVYSSKNSCNLDYHII
ncbi:hypothetical protein RFI_25027 [Reticulomyxa filosa]|uniref:Conserved Oligomeric Golgi complex subunit 6 C-terminal domain-containing protein n=1 Tax=Reticulomyxa filosa TaxID=46433 RepID=X6MH24_RETFI|nr:hypothetical protein RFI_25027 [Reticulomyxa filosa]|eukprot:ETO12350.1 hypothetical protein RFI_25027 [Reticulomyxa filosa]